MLKRFLLLDTCELICHHPLSTSKHLRVLASLMSHTHPTGPESPNFQLIFNNALKAYENQTKNDILFHPLVADLQACQSPSAILTILQQQVQELDQSRTGDERLTRWLDLTVNVLYAFSETIGEGVSLVHLMTRTLSYIQTLILIRQVFSPAKVIFAGFGVLLSVCSIFPLIA